ncbi:alpha-amylase family protein [Cryptosporangium aurantiacum]|uniref:Maltose alpha-D-glucosyltransferase/ alpha-amylase n=1 Tax=Cryptosporangium aurantiacum TaxID=134849 RepID=A0A1M7QC23_9ACTN|nr:alpha-amylase family protein [Cryptosporangium aurantiacum]SHN28367.1 maltose alpha-D-glucosyltransferase/ alpha-amylase [Cryptosporangium aurantiacum]
MPEHWYREAVVYCCDVDTFQDSNGDGIGDFPGLTSRLDYLARLGVTCLWLNPIHPTPNRDDGYDVADFYAVDPRLGTLGDFAELLHEAGNRGIRVIIDLVVNHTSNQHPWFQSARSSEDSPYRDWYVWSKDEPKDRREGMVFPGEQQETWSYDRTAKAWFYHRFYDFMPDLNTANPEVRAEIKRIAAFWIQLGVAGFRMDAAPFVIEATANSPKDFEFLTDLRAHLQWRRGDSVILAEANVGAEELPEYFGDSGGSANRLNMLFDFTLNARLMLALARGDAEPVIDALRDTPRLPESAQWATFLRNHDEVDLSKLTSEQRADVFAEFGPDKEMQLYDRGIRRRLAPMLGNDRRRLELAYALQFSLRGTPVIRYGEEIGMGEDLSLNGRDAIRTPMQWTPGRNGGFSHGDELVRPAVSGGEFGYERLNVVTQQQDPGSLLSWFERMIRTLRQCPEVGLGGCSVVDVPMPRHVLVHQADQPERGAMVFLHNLADEDVTVDLSELGKSSDDPYELLADRNYPPVDNTLSKIPLAGYGYRWIRLRDSTGRRTGGQATRGGLA